MPQERLPHQHLVERFGAARADRGLAVLEGFHALKHALRFGARVEAVATSDADALERLAAALAPDLAGAFRARAEVVAPDVLRTLAPRTPATRVVAIARRPAVDPAAVLAAPDGSVVLLEDPRHLGNVGAVVRVAAAAGAAGVLTTGPRDPWDPAALRGSAGLHFAVPVARCALDAVEGGGRPLVALDPGGAPLRPGAVPARAVLAFGSERHGLGEALLARAAARLAIPMRPGVSSLNLATAVAVALYAGGLARA
jgi:RNA methyltransferase, TrmH family